MRLSVITQCRTIVDFMNIEKINRWLIVLLLASLTTVISIQIFSRYVINFSIFWTEELARYLLVWTALTGAALALKENAHIAINVLVECFPDKTKTKIILLSKIITLVFLISLFYVGFSLALSMYSQKSDALRIPLFWPYLSIPASAALMSFYLLSSLIKKHKEE